MSAPGEEESRDGKEATEDTESISEEEGEGRRDEGYFTECHPGVCIPVMT